MCGGTDPATGAAQARERSRLKQVSASTSAIESAFGSKQRNRQLKDFIAALRSRFQTEAGRQKVDIKRRSKFGLARSGLTGGSEAADRSVDIGRKFQKGIIEGERQSQASLSDLISADNAAKQNLIALAQGGASVTTSASQAGEALRSNISSASSRTNASSLGNIFEDVEENLTAAEKAAGRRRGLRESEIFADPFSRGSS